ncbi:MAG: hypothetical protein MUE53_09925 [Chitinophagales bacterium]|nr:hypothetical protein [Chitinophagales bacterium]
MKSFVIFLSCIFLSLLSCDNTRMKHSSEVEFIYFNERLINLFNQNSYPDFVAKMHEEYPGVFDFYNQFLLGIVDESKDYIASQADYQNFMSQEYPAILDSIRLKIYPDSALINREISNIGAYTVKTFGI